MITYRKGEVRHLPRNRRHANTKFSYNCAIICRSHLPHQRYLHKNYQHFRNIFGWIVVLYLVRLRCYFLVAHFRYSELTQSEVRQQQVTTPIKIVSHTFQKSPLSNKSSDLNTQRKLLPFSNKSATKPQPSNTLGWASTRATRTPRSCKPRYIDMATETADITPVMASCDFHDDGIKDT